MKKHNDKISSQVIDSPEMLKITPVCWILLVMYDSKGVIMETKNNWFGKGCRHFQGVWKQDDPTLSSGTPQEWEPVLVLCTHDGNPFDCGGNCNRRDCPLLNV